MIARDGRSRVQIVLTGAYGNLGDAVIRRRALEWVRPLGEVHAYVGNAPDSWIEQLGLGGGDVVYRSGARFAWMSSFFARSRPVAFVLDPGEVPLGRRDLPAEIVMLLMTLAARVRGAAVIRPPRGLGKISRVTLFVHKLASALSHEKMWRNERSMAIMGRGRATPDIAFQEPTVEGSPFAARPTLVVSMRGKRSFPSSNWVQAITRIAAERNLRIVCLSQVREDEVRTEELAHKLSASVVKWDRASDLEHEVRVRQEYEAAQIVVSDRLHVLILSALAGAVPIELADSPKGKVDEHFSQIGASGVSVDTSTMAANDVLERVRGLIAGREELRARMTAASSELDEVERDVRGLIEQSKLRR